HPAEPRQREGAVCLPEEVGGPRHRRVVAHVGPPRVGGTAQRRVPSDLPRGRLPDPAREEAEQRENQDDDEDDPEDSHGCGVPLSVIPLTSKETRGLRERQEPLARRLDAVSVAECDEVAALPLGPAVRGGALRTAYHVLRC